MDARILESMIPYLECVEVSESLLEQIKKATVFKEVGNYHSPFGKLNIVVDPTLKDNEYRLVLNLHKGHVQKERF
jgi:hypothetical protein